MSSTQTAISSFFQTVTPKDKAVPKQPTGVKRKREFVLKGKKESAPSIKKLKMEEKEEEEGVQEQRKGTYLANNYDPLAAATWKKGERVPYLFLAQTFEKIGEVSSRKEIVKLLTNLFRSILLLTPEDLLLTIYLCINRIAPSYENVELGIGEATLLTAIAESTGCGVKELKAKKVAVGDLGVVAKECRASQATMFAPPRLTCQYVFNTLGKIALASGRQSQQLKKGLIQRLLVACRDCESLFIIRSLQGKLRIGLAERSVETALAHALVLTAPWISPSPPPSPSPPSLLPPPPPPFKSFAITNRKEQERITEWAVGELKEVLSQVPSYSKVLPILLSCPPHLWNYYCHLTPSIPVKPMLAFPAKGLEDIFSRFAECNTTCEWKYDGERAQIHYLPDRSIHIYSRNLESNSTKYPDITTTLPNSIEAGVESFIVDCEVVAYDREQMQIRPFQILSTRSRKDVALEDVKVNVCLYVFDLLYLNGKSMLKEEFKERRAMLHKSFIEIPGQFQFAKYLDTKDEGEITNFLNESIAGHCEGLMVKSLDKGSTYEPSKRSHKWLKVKKDYLTGLSDSLDLVPIAGFYGQGKRNGVYGSYLLACYDEATEEYQNICKIGTGFSETDLEEFTKLFKEHVIPAPKSYYRFSTQVTPDVWFEPSVVWEVKAADLSLSPHYTAAMGLVSESKGISLRFPRFVRIRDDKSPEDATNADQIAEMYRAQGLAS